MRLRNAVKGADMVARFGGDEFVVMLENLSVDAAEAAGEAELVGEKILALLKDRTAVGANLPERIKKRGKVPSKLPAPSLPR